MAKDAVTQCHLVNILEMDNVLEICRSLGVDGVVPTTELTFQVAAYIAEKMGLNGMPFDVAKVVTDKYRNRMVCKDVPDLYQPGFARINSLEELDSLNFSFPIILKPASRGGKLGVSVVNNEEELMPAFKLARTHSRNAPIILEEFISGGQEYSVETLSFHGMHTVIQVTEKISSGPPHCVELGHHQPASLSRGMRDKVVRVIEKALPALGIDNSPCHIEIKIVGDRIYLIECNARPGGDYISWVLTELSTGYPYIKGVIDIALDCFEPIDTSTLLKHYAGVYFIAAQSAYLKPLFDRCEEFPWLYRKNFVSDNLQTLVHNDCDSINSMIYYSETERPDIESAL